MIQKKTQIFIEKYLWIIFAILGVLGAAVIWFLMPHDAKIESFGHLIFKVMIFVFIVSSISVFPNKDKSKYKYLLLTIPIIFYLTYLLPRLSYLGYLGIPQNEANAGNEFYTHLYLLLFPSILLSLSAAYRLGGATAGSCFKISMIGIMLIFSGYMDLMWFVINPVKIPEIIPYANHIQIFFGRQATYSEGIFFAIAHLPFLIGIILIPIDKWINKYLGIDL